MHTSKQRPAFTLVELLVVIAIIAILASIVIPAVGIMMVRAAEAKTQGVLTQIESAITTYETNTGKHPLQENNSFTDSADNAVADVTTFFTPGNVHEVNAALTKVLASIDQDNFGPTGEMAVDGDIDGTDVRQIVDAWDEPIYYQPWTAYLSNGNAINPGTYQLWSFGPDLENGVEGGVAEPVDEEDIENNPLPYGDDITNWNG